MAENTNTDPFAALSFEETETPKETRTAAPNPFTGKFPLPEGKAIAVTLPSSTEEEKKAIQRLIDLAQKEGNRVGSTTRKKTEEVTVGTGKSAKKMTKVTFWSVDKITRERKPKDSEAPATASE